MAPETTIDSAPSGTTSDSTPTFIFSSVPSVSSFECELDGPGFSACTSPHTTGTLADGNHTFKVVATDPDGSTDPTPASRGFTVDTAPPVTPPPPPAAADCSAPDAALGAAEEQLAKAKKKQKKAKKSVKSARAAVTEAEGAAQACQ